MPASSSVPTWTVPLSWNEIRNRAHEFSRRWAGEVTLRRALAQSINTVAVRLNQQVGSGRAIEVGIG